jgi:hypothetical protein
MIFQNSLLPPSISFSYETEQDQEYNAKEYIQKRERDRERWKEGRKEGIV